MFIVNKDKTKIYNLDHIAKIRIQGHRIEAVTGDTVEELGEYTTPVETKWALEHIMSRIVDQKPLIEMPAYADDTPADMAERIVNGC